MTLNHLTANQITNKRVLLRTDFNVPLKDKDGQLVVADDSRLLSSLPTIELIKKHARQLIIISHLGRPEGKPDPKYSLQPVAKRLGELLGIEVELSSFPAFRLSRSPVILIENLRFNKGEEANDPNFAKLLASLADVYVNDAFSACHREHASITGIPQYLPTFAGLGLIEEVNQLSMLLSRAERPFVVIIGGKKISDKLEAVQNLAKIANKVLVGGATANNFIAAQNIDVKSSYLEEPDKKGVNYIEEAENILESKLEPKILLPIDVVTGDSPQEDHTPQIVKLNQPNDIKHIDHKEMYLDIGPETIEVFISEINKAKTIFWNGPLGAYENPDFAHGTKKIGQAILNSQAKSVIGGGDTIAALNQLGLSGFTYLSGSGGAALEFLAHGTLPGLEKLQ